MGRSCLLKGHIDVEGSETDSRGHEGRLYASGLTHWYISGALKGVLTVLDPHANHRQPLTTSIQASLNLLSYLQFRGSTFDLDWHNLGSTLPLSHVKGASILARSCYSEHILIV